MKQTIGIRFSRYGQALACLYDADSPIAVGESAMVMTERGPSCGLVVWQRPWQEELEQTLRAANAAIQNISGNAEAEDGEEESTPSSMPVARRATQEEIAAAQSNALLSQEAYQFCRSCIAERMLDMKLVDVEILFDRSKMVFFFTAPTRIDFRDLVKDLVREYHTRIELRQIGVRHETQMLGALGNCGMVCCCRRYLHKFAPVTIKMAKEQNLFLNPAKISGICGRLLCCLSYEQENYDDFHHSCPRIGKRYQTTEGFMRVLRTNMFRNSVAVLPDGGQERELSIEEWQALRPSRSEGAPSFAGNEQKSLTSPNMVVFSTAPDTLDADIADIEVVENLPSPPSHEPSMMNAEEAMHRKKRPHHHMEHHEKKGRSQLAQEQKDRHAPEVASGQNADAK